MSVITNVEEPNLWEEICKEFAQKKPPFEEDDDNASVATDYENFNPSIHNPVFYGKMFAKVTADEDAISGFDSSKSHPSCIGHSFTNKPSKPPSPAPLPPPNKLSCTHTEYLNNYVFPWLLPALEAMLKQAKLEKCFEDKSHVLVDQQERRRTKFNACDFITEYLYRHNPNQENEQRKTMELWDIPFVQEWLKDHPRPPLPMSLIWTDEEAVLIIQSFWRGYLVRREPDVQELRAWQREWREENRGIEHRVNEFWKEQMPDEDVATPKASETQDDSLNTESNNNNNNNLEVKSPLPDN